MHCFRCPRCPAYVSIIPQGMLPYRSLRVGRLEERLDTTYGVARPVRAKAVSARHRGGAGLPRAG